MEESSFETSKSPAVQNQVLSLTEDRQLELFGKLISDDSEQSIAAYARKLYKKYRKITRQIEEMAWVDEHQLFERIYENDMAQLMLGNPHVLLMKQSLY